MRQCKVFVHDMEAGILQETDTKEYVFTYGGDYQGEPVCLAMPVRKERVIIIASPSIRTVGLFYAQCVKYQVPDTI